MLAQRMKEQHQTALTSAENAKKTAAEREAEVVAEREKRLAMKNQLEAMEKKLLVGAKIIDDAKRQKIEAERNEAEAERLRVYTSLTYTSLSPHSLQSLWCHVGYVNDN
jgi:hypothetical protein